MNIDLLLTTSGTGTGNSGGSLLTWLILVIIMIAIFYRLLVVPEKKKREKRKEMLKSLEVGDVVVTTNGFIGILIDITEDEVIVEFGSNPNCRIPMLKTAIEAVEKAEIESGEKDEK